MEREHILRWMFEFGGDWVDVETLHDTWAGRAFSWYEAYRDGYLDRTDTGNTALYKLTPYAINMLENKEGEHDRPHEHD